MNEKDLPTTNANENSPAHIGTKKKSCKAKRPLLPICDAKCLVPSSDFDYDLIVIGAGVAGLAAAIEASKLGAKVAIVNFVEPTPSGTKWGIGGTCINIGSIPKKLFHIAALLGDQMKGSEYFGWDFGQKMEVDWIKLKNAVQKHIKDKHYAIKLELFECKIDYYYAKASFKDPHTIETVRKGKTKLLKGRNILIAVGSQSIYPNIPGVSLGITTDDLFSLDRVPGKTLIVGDGYMSAEIAGILNGLGYETDILCMKPEPDMDLDSTMTLKIVAELETRGVQFNFGSKIEYIKPACMGKKLKVAWYQEQTQKHKLFDTVIFCMGRKPYTADLGLQNAGVEFAEDGGKIFAVNEQTNVPHIYAIGDVLYGKPELSSVAQQAGQLLARRIFAGSTCQMNYDLIPGTVFTPLEYSYIGLSEDLALSKYGEDNLEIYHAYYKPATSTVAKRDIKNYYVKVVALREGDQKVVGMHYMGENAGEVVQGFACAMMCGLTMKTLRDTVHVHPTTGAEFIKLTITKRSMEDPNPSVCCS